ncbi:MAG: hypothetical protein ACRES5_29130 [Pseudomonas sp.]
MDTKASEVLTSESKSNLQTMLQNIQVGDTLEQEGRDLKVLTKTFKEKDSGYTIGISLESGTLESENLINYTEMLWMIQAGDILVLDGKTRIVREKVILNSGSNYSPSIYLMNP